MKRTNLFRRTFALFATAAIAAALVFALLALLIMDRLYVEANVRVLGETARALAPGLPESALVPGEEGRLAAAAWSLAAIGPSELRLTLIGLDGLVLADTRADPLTMENHGSRPEVRAALAGELGSSRRRSATLGRELMYAAYPVSRGDRRVAVLRLALEVPSLATRLKPELGNLALLVAVFLLAAAGAAALFSRRLSSPLSRLATAALDYSASGFGPATRSRVPGPDSSSAQRFRGIFGAEEPLPGEYRDLASALDAMAQELAKRMEAARAQGRELEAILHAMAEAVLALDADLKVRLANPAAVQLFCRPGEAALAGRDLLEATRSTELGALVGDCLHSGSRRQVEIALYGNGERWYQALAAPLAGGSGAEPQTGQGLLPAVGAGAAAGAVLVLNDITELRRLERVRRDFVANVSHELRTPVQLIKGFAETLRGEDEPERRGRFLAIIERNAQRMEDLIHDLLTLARLEQEGRSWLGLEDADLALLLAEAVQTLAPKAEEKRMTIELDCPRDLRARVNAGLLEQALLNLVDNAVKYSPAGSRVRVEASIAGRPGDLPPGPRLLLSVRDWGPGIPARDLGRIFERFYRVDKARSRALGGTGLGLAIVRHIALAHGGTVSVESWEGEGSLFTITIPLGIEPRAPGTA